MGKFKINIFIMDLNKYFFIKVRPLKPLIQKIFVFDHVIGF